MIASPYPLLQVNIFTFPGKAIEEAEAVRQAFIDTLKQRAFDELGPLDIQLVGWRGIEGRDVMVEVRFEGASSLYELVTPDMVPRIIQSHLDEHRPVRRWVVGKDFEAYYEPQKMHVSELLGKIDPQCLEEYQDYDGYKALRSFYSQGFDSFLQKVVAAGFCEFSRTTSAAFGPAWCELRVEKQRPILVVNAAPPSLNATSEILLLEGVPHQVLEGILLAVNTLQAEAVIVYLPVEATLARERLRSGWEKLLQGNILPPSHKPVHLEILASEPRFLVEDEDLFTQYLHTTLPTSFWHKYPDPTFLFHGLGTIAALPFIAQTPVSWFRKLGIACAPGTMIFRLMGAVEQPGFVEVPLSATLGEVINGVGGGFRHGRNPKAILVGGALGGIFPANYLQISLNHDTLRELGASLAMGTIQVLDEKDCIVSLVRQQIDFLLDQPGAQCPTCHQFLIRIKELLAEIAGGEARKDTLEELKTTCERLKITGSCHLGRQAANPILTSLQFFMAEYRMHTDNKNCPARVCPKLLPGPAIWRAPRGSTSPATWPWWVRGAFWRPWR